MRLPRSCAAVVLGLAALIASPAATAYSYVLMRDDALLAQSDGVLVGVVQDVQAGRSGTESRYTLAVERVLAGAAQGTTVELALPGTPAQVALPKGVPRLQVPGIPVLREGDHVMVFYARRDDGVLQPQQLLLGLFFRVEMEGGDLYIRALDDYGNLAPEKNAAFAAPRDADAFEAWITGAGSDPYLRPLSGAAKFTLILYDANPNDGVPGNPFRWFTFDGGGTVQWHALSSGMAGATFNENEAVDDALAAWTTDAGSRILLDFAGTVAGDSGNDGTNGINAVVWDDPGGDIAGSYNCAQGGTLATGGSFFSTNLTPGPHRSWYPAVEGYVITQNGAACFFNGHGGADGEEVLAHEFGHTLGFGHSCGDSQSPSCASSGTLNDAIMRATAHGDGRGASLRADDRAAAAYSYPAPTGGGFIFGDGFES